MKFIGLILMCAASSMALLLPAIGVVKFPILDQASLQQAQASTSQDPLQSTPAQNPDPQTSAGLLVAAQVSGADNAPQAPQPPAPTSELLGKLPFTQIPSQRMGLGVWLLLVPSILLGLAMWTFGSNPKTSK
jgi:hypothetical protein